VHAAFQVGLRADDVLAFGVVVEGARRDVGEVPEAVPLRAALGVQGVEVVVGDAVGEGLDRVLEGFAVEGGLFGDGEGEVDGDDLAGADFAGGSGDAGWCEEVQSANLRSALALASELFAFPGSCGMLT